MFNPGDVMVIDFPGVTGVKHRPTVVVSSPVYHASRPDVVVGLITTKPRHLALRTTYCRIGHRLACGSPQFFAVFLPRCLPLPILCLSAICQTAIGRGYAHV